MQSMTGYAYQTSEGSWGRATCEIRSLNHRYLDFNFKLSEPLRPLEVRMRELGREYLERGRLDVTLTFYPGAEVQGDLYVNTKLAEQLIQIAEEWRLYANSAEKVDIVELLKWPGVITSHESNTEVLHEPILNLFETTLSSLKQSRLQEGEMIREKIYQRWQHLKTSVYEAAELRTSMHEKVNEKLQNRFKEANVEIDSQRFEQELIYLANKVDVSEELDRLQVHVDQVDQLLSNGQPVGRRIDFLLQEISREANTIASKSPDTKMTQHAVDIKAYLEQVREQIQNVE